MSIISPYAMHYELAIFAPAVAIYLAGSQDRAWLGYLLATVVSSLALHPMFLALLSVLSLPMIRQYVRPHRRRDRP